MGTNDSLSVDVSTMGVNERVDSSVLSFGLVFKGRLTFTFAAFLWKLVESVATVQFPEDGDRSDSVLLEEAFCTIKCWRTFTVGELCSSTIVAFNKFARLGKLSKLSSANADTEESQT